LLTAGGQRVAEDQGVEPRLHKDGRSEVGPNTSSKKKGSKERADAKKRVTLHLVPLGKKLGSHMAKAGVNYSLQLTLK
jgi:hypothetical protein